MSKDDDMTKLREWFAPSKAFWDGVKCIEAELDRHEPGDPNCENCTRPGIPATEDKEGGGE